MSILSRIGAACCRLLPLLLGQPACPACRAIRRRKAKKIVELNIGDGRRAKRLIRAARRASPGETIHYVGIDPFEGRSAADGPGLTLKDAYKRLKSDGVRVRLVPGDPAEALIREANALGKVDLLLVPEEMDSPTFARTWFFVPRMLHDDSLVFVERTGADGKTLLAPKSRAEIDALASPGKRRAA